MDKADLKKISPNKLKQLDLMVLLNILHRVGFKTENIIFESRLSLSQSGRLIEDIVFDQDGIKLIVNMGILSANSTLPDHLLDFFSIFNDSMSFTILNALASKLLKHQINMLLIEQSDNLKHLYLNGDVLFTRNDNFFYSLSSYNSLFERTLAQYQLNAKSEWKLDLINKASYLNKKTNFTNMHLGSKLLSSRLHLVITLQSEYLFNEDECKEISQHIERLVLSKIFDINREYIMVTVWLIVHPIKITFIPFALSQNTKLMNYKIKIYERDEYGH
ncbi:hypothetical protein IB642_03925 [Allofrancisella guangzhouensis]|uniref:Uncharacterized protein n=1 Tax=Allofrancisella guangzhouensis TaxID=594679 RepID=A0A0A8E2Y7_9GAMM|nr:hypothetical protein [Allofrancisella guangzhouensis]AJC48373.1 hypothetical protein SD28_01210 [Allofrancisella guangzhouensis]MBK2026680.1 hypothetical protein [Allofrancisella guangzhouensis]MBK2044167.1 hypothetical protein [Allofrancisella guangzhouensis]MBK2045517.1 hypothetical protein [Allofrancisella guangzhouensis]